MNPRLLFSAAAIKLSSGEVISAPMHVFAYERAEILGLSLEACRAGFISRSTGDFVLLEEADMLCGKEITSDDLRD